MEEVKAPQPKEVLVHLINNLELVEKAFENIKKFHPFFPQLAESITCWYVLQQSGFTLPYAPLPGALSMMLERSGWKRLGEDSVTKPGDIYIQVEEESDKVVQLGFVAKESFRYEEGELKPADWIYVMDNFCFDCKPRRLEKDKIDYLLGFG